ncbi:chaperonin 10-like protein [Dunaliella salina]|uniref:Chaperonin 10-like protein n=1 Tax=Dunaliella salina TaxID=3046 RepID=A0ABQ7GI11_DUNSA|nr:chaperonin 10-like protein [Dunaliella salina]|eukprot:KAF5834252.1 chaperonin 10-like protein [Dunaliella salina]
MLCRLRQGACTLSPSQHRAQLAIASVPTKALQRAGSSRDNRSTATTMNQDQAATNTQPTLHKAWEVTEPGAVSRLRLTERPLSALQPGQATVQVHAIGLNMADLFSVLGLYAAFQANRNKTPGLEFAGVITNVREGSGGSSKLKVGDRVVGITKFGAFSTHVNLELPYLRHFPQEWDFPQAAAFPVQALTALYGLQNLGGLRPNSCLLIHSAAGGVGLAALKIARHFNCRVLGTVGSPSKVQLLQERYSGSQGEMHFVARTSPGNLKEEASTFLRQQGLQGFDIVFDSLQGSYFQPGYDLLAPCGRAVLFGAGSMTPAVGADAAFLSNHSLSSLVSLLSPAKFAGLLGTITGYLTRPKLDLLKLPGENKGVLGFNLIWLYENIDMFEALYQSLEELQLDAPMVGSTYPFAELPAALEHLQSGQSVGKVIVQVKH